VVAAIVHIDAFLKMSASQTFTPAKLRAWLVVLALVFVASCSRTNERKSFVPPPATSAAEQTLTGRVVSVADGDTVTVLDAENTQHRIRLSGIDAPESHQAFGSRSKQSLSDLVFGRDVAVLYSKTDQYGRLVGKIMFDGQDANLVQVKAGMAWHYKEYQREQTPEDRDLYARAEEEARAQHRGLWQDPNPIEPSQFRREQREERRGKSTTVN
jgi:endonuclease YncB( thermonuclease family)